MNGGGDHQSSRDDDQGREEEESPSRRVRRRAAGAGDDDSNGEQQQQDDSVILGLEAGARHVNQHGSGRDINENSGSPPSLLGRRLPVARNNNRHRPAAAATGGRGDDSPGRRPRGRGSPRRRGGRGLPRNSERRRRSDAPHRTLAYLYPRSMSAPPRPQTHYSLSSGNNNTGNNANPNSIAQQFNSLFHVGPSSAYHYLQQPGEATRAAPAISDPAAHGPPALLLPRFCDTTANNSYGSSNDASRQDWWNPPYSIASGVMTAAAGARAQATINSASVNDAVARHQSPLRLPAGLQHLPRNNDTTGNHIGSSGRRVASNYRTNCGAIAAAVAAAEARAAAANVIHHNNDAGNNKNDGRILTLHNPLSGSAPANASATPRGARAPTNAAAGVAAAGIAVARRSPARPPSPTNNNSTSNVIACNDNPARRFDDAADVAANASATAAHHPAAAPSAAPANDAAGGTTGPASPSIDLGAIQLFDGESSTTCDFDDYSDFDEVLYLPKE